MTSLSERLWHGLLAGFRRQSLVKSRRAAGFAAGALAAWCVVSLVGGCELAVEVDIPPQDPNLVVHSFFAPDSAWAVRLGRNTDVEGRDNVRSLVVTDAAVRITDDSGDYSAELTHVGGGLYQYGGSTPIPGPHTDADAPQGSGAHPIPGAAYTLEAEAPGLPAIRAVASIPAARASIEKVERLEFPDPPDVPPGFRFAEVYRVRLRIEDPPGTNYYKLEVFRWSPVVEATEVAIGFIGDPEPIILDDPSAVWAFVEIPFSTGESALRYDDYAYFFDPPEPADENRLLEGALFSDELFEGGAKSFEITVTNYTLETVEPRYKVVLTALSEDYFQYHHTALLQSESTGELNIEAALLQTPPVQLHSNVEEGLGVFAGYAAHAFGFDGEGNAWVGDDRPE